MPNAYQNIRNVQCHYLMSMINIMAQYTCLKWLKIYSNQPLYGWRNFEFTCPKWLKYTWITQHGWIKIYLNLPVLNGLNILDSSIMIRENFEILIQYPEINPDTFHNILILRLFGPFFQNILTILKHPDIILTPGQPGFGRGQKGEK